MFRIAFVSGKLGDVDGVSLEVTKWADILAGMGHEIFAIAGQFVSDIPHVQKKNRCLLAGLRFDSPLQKKAEKLFFPHMGHHVAGGRDERKSLVEKIEDQGAMLGNKIHAFVLAKGIDVLISENINALPMSFLGAIAVHRLATESKVAVIFHHHDFWWERSRFSGSHVENLLHRMMPPADPGNEHVVLSSYAAHILRSIKRVHPHIIPNCEDFAAPPVKDSYNSAFREDLGFREEDILFLQPTRIVPRKRIEDSITLVARFCNAFPEFRNRVHFLISLYQGDEPDMGYIRQIKTLARENRIPIHMISDRVGAVRRLDAKGRRIYNNRDVLVQADFVTYLPIWEGFGNALLEAIAAKVPLVVSTYLVYKSDIMGRGLDLVEIRDEYDQQGHLLIPEEAVSKIHAVLTAPDERKRIVENNFAVMAKSFGYDLLRKRLEDLITAYGDEIKASRSRLYKKRVVFSV